MKHKQTCVICGNVFTSTRCSQVCCSAECKRKRKNELHAETMKEQRIKERNKKKSDLAGLSRKAREMGMSYGKMQALKYIEENKV